MPDGPAPGQGVPTTGVQPAGTAPEVQPQQARNPDGTFAGTQPQVTPAQNGQGLVEKYIPQGVDPAVQEAARQALEAARQEWDANVTRRIQTVHDQYADQDAMFRWLQTNPVEALNWVADQYQAAGRDIRQEVGWAQVQAAAAAEQAQVSQEQQVQQPQSLTPEEIQRQIQEGIGQGLSELQQQQLRSQQEQQLYGIMDELAQAQGIAKVTPGMRQAISSEAANAVDALRGQGYSGDELARLALQAGVESIVNAVRPAAQPQQQPQTLPQGQQVPTPAPGQTDPRIIQGGATPGPGQPQPWKTQDERVAGGLAMLKALQSQP